MREHRLRELAEHNSQNGLIFVARCTCGWSGSACFHNRENAVAEHRSHSMQFIDGSADVLCAFCGNVLPARVAQRFFAETKDELRFLCDDCTSVPALVPAAAGPPISEVRADLIVLERELRTC